MRKQSKHPKSRYLEDQKKERKSKLPDDPTDETLLYREQIADYCKVSKMTVIKWINDGLLKEDFIQGRIHQTKLGTVKRFLDNQKNQPTPNEPIPTETQNEIKRIGDIVAIRKKNREDKTASQFNKLLIDGIDLNDAFVKQKFDKFDKSLLIRYLEEKERWDLLEQLFGEQ